jgi:hypothetical protein
MLLLNVLNILLSCYMPSHLINRASNAYELLPKHFINELEQEAHNLRELAVMAVIKAPQRCSNYPRANIQRVALGNSLSSLKVLSVNCSRLVRINGQIIRCSYINGYGSSQ